MILGCKVAKVNVVYSLVTNLKKTGDMDVGQVGFHEMKRVNIRNDS